MTAGWIDLQVNGWGGVGFSHPDLDRGLAEQACDQILATGTAGFLATVITSPESLYQRNLPILASVDHPACLGLHLEGPFFVREGGALGVHDARWCRAADIAALERWQDMAHGRIRMLTLGADVAGADELTAAARTLGIAVSLGHHLADAAQLRACAVAGASALTHLGNGLPTTIHRHCNPIWSGLAEERLAVMVIADGHHLPPAVLKVIARAAGPRLVLVSDAAPVAGLAAGRYSCFGRAVAVDARGRVEDLATGGCAGSATSLAGCVAFAGAQGLLDVEAAAHARPLALLA